MFVLHLEHAPDSIRGILSLYALEVAPFMFVSSAPAKIRDEIWLQITKIEGVSAVMIFSANNEQGYALKTYGYPMYNVTTIDGLSLIEKPENFLTKEIAEKLWAKTNPKKSLIDHMIETGIVAECLMSCVFSKLTDRLAEISQSDKNELTKQIAFICSLHDIGKAHPVFQGKDYDTYAMLDRHGIAQNVIKSREDGFRHEVYAEDLLYDMGFAEDICNIIGLHHQKSRGSVSISSNIKQRWNEIQKYLYDFVHNAFPCDTSFPKLSKKEDQFLLNNGVLGVLITSDWIASNPEVFPDNLSYKDFSSIDKCVAYKKNQIMAFILQEHLINHEIPKAKTFSEMFHLPTLRPVQEDAAKIVKSENVSVMLIESGCGSGKTEAALYAASVLGRKTNASGFYIGLPTGASAEAMQSRADVFMDSIGFGATKLYTSKASLLHEHNMEPAWTDISTRRMLTQSAVGTVDQVMTVARLVRFESVRMAGLSSKVLIIDEIHAYDAFMLGTIISLLKICFKLHVPVIMLSATLPIDTKKMLFSAVSDNTNINIEKGYPMISYMTYDKIYHEHVSQSHEPDKRIRFELLPTLGQPNEVAKQAVKNVENDGCEAVILNLVDDAINVYDEIKKIAPEDCKLILYHARMPINTRGKKTKMILKMFGKNRGSRPKKAIVVSTQVLEQSLDISFDYMITAIAPIDLIIQRTGRYRRHGNYERDGIVQVLIPEDRHYGKNESVYEQCYLKATENELKNRVTLSIPSDNPDVINNVYSQQDSRSLTHDVIKRSSSDEGNININKGFSLHKEMNNRNREILKDRYLSVRDNDNSVNIAVMPADVIKNIGQGNDIDLYKEYVVSIPGYKINDILGEYGQGIFRGVKIFTADKQMFMNDEYGLVFNKN